MFKPQDNYGNWRPALCLMTLIDELNAWDPEWQCLGLIGDQTHQEEAAYSDHNPIVLDPKTGMGIVRAIDIRSSTPAKQEHLFQFVNAMYNARDPRIYFYGYAHMDNRITPWDNDPATSEQPNPGDVGHLHVSVTQSTYPSTPGGYVAAIDSLAPWGIASSFSPEGGGVPLPPPVVPPKDDDDMPKLIRATDDSGAPTVVKDQVFLFTGLTCSEVGKDAKNTPGEGLARLRALQLTCGSPVDMIGAHVFRHIREAGNAQAGLAPGVLG